MSFSSPCLISGPNTTSKNFIAGNYYIKFFDWDNDTEPRLLVMINQALSDVGVNVPKFFCNKEGKEITVDENLKKCVFVQEKIEGGFFNGSILHLRKLLSLLDKFNYSQERLSRLRGLPSPLLNWCPVEKIKLLRKVIRDGASHDLSGFALDVLEQAEKFYLNNMGLINVEDLSVSHFDLHPHNIIFNDLNSISVIDLETVGYFPIKIANSFSIYKAMRKSIANLGLGKLELLRELDSFELSCDEIRVNSLFEVHRRILIILESCFLDKVEKRNYDLQKQVSSLSEIEFIFG